uniref:Uncharacterized protein n=1 Tax=Octopus bimaculoides TaxID=37653 RepID=A0A0L8H8W6_OCTBM
MIVPVNLCRYMCGQNIACTHESRIAQSITILTKRCQETAFCLKKSFTNWKPNIFSWKCTQFLSYVNENGKFQLLILGSILILSE